MANISWKGQLIMDHLPEHHEPPVTSAYLETLIPELSKFQISAEISWRLENAHVQVDRIPKTKGSGTRSFYRKVAR